jgi:two-component system chemotaxis sensor kinase CheA
MSKFNFNDESDAVLDSNTKDSLLEVYVYEVSELLEQLEQIIIAKETSHITESDINEMFRVLHTIKGSSAMMGFDQVTALSHSLEDLISYVRDEGTERTDYSFLSDPLLKGLDFIKGETEKIKKGHLPDGEASKLTEENKKILDSLKAVNRSLLPDKKEYKAVIAFEEGSGMENVRALSVLRDLYEIGDIIFYEPNDLENEKSKELIKEKGFSVTFASDESMEKIREHLNKTMFMSGLDLQETGKEKTAKEEKEEKEEKKEQSAESLHEARAVSDGMVSVKVSKLDILMDLVGEMVIAQSAVLHDPGITAIKSSDLEKTLKRLERTLGEIHETVLSIRMVPLFGTFMKMHRVVRDMSKKLNKKVRLVTAGEDTEVDKSIIDRLSEPLMHLVRNAVDHGLESSEERRNAGKSETGTVTLEAKNSGNYVVITVRDDGRGLNREKILEKAKKNGLLHKDPDTMTDKEVFEYIFLPGFSTNDSVTEYSGRGVGMDAAEKTIQSIGGTLSVDSALGEGTEFTVKIPLMLNILDSVHVKSSDLTFTLPSYSIKEFIDPKNADIVKDANGDEMLLLRGKCFPLVRLDEFYGLRKERKVLEHGLIILVEDEKRFLALYADTLAGRSRAVIKGLPAYIKKTAEDKGFSGCTLLGDGTVSFILDVKKLTEYAHGYCVLDAYR